MSLALLFGILFRFVASSKSGKHAWKHRVEPTERMLVVDRVNASGTG